MKIGITDSKKTVPSGKLKGNAILTGIGIGLAAAVALSAAATAAVNKAAEAKKQK